MLSLRKNRNTQCHQVSELQCKRCSSWDFLRMRLIRSQANLSGETNVNRPLWKLIVHILGCKISNTIRTWLNRICGVVIILYGIKLLCTLVRGFA